MLYISSYLYVYILDSLGSHLLILALTSEIQDSHLSDSCVLDVGMLSIINRDKKKKGYAVIVIWINWLVTCMQSYKKRREKKKGIHIFDK